MDKPKPSGGGGKQKQAAPQVILQIYTKHLSSISLRCIYSTCTLTEEQVIKSSLYLSFITLAISRK